MNEQAILIRVAKDCLVKRITTFVLPVLYFKPQGCFGDAINFRGKVPPLIMEEGFAIGEEELQVTYLRSVNPWVIDPIYTAAIARAPHPARGRILRTHANSASAR